LAIGHQPVDPRPWRVAPHRGGGERTPQCGVERRPTEPQIGEEGGMAAALAVGGLPWRMAEDTADEIEIKVVKQRSVVEDRVPPDAKRVPRDLAVAVGGGDRQIARSASHHRPSGGRQRGTERIEHVVVQHVDRRCAAGVAGDHRPHHASGPEHDREPAAGPPEHLDTQPRAGIEIDLLRGATRRTEHHGRPLGHPAADDTPDDGRLVGLVEERLVEREIGRRAGRLGGKPGGACRVGGITVRSLTHSRGLLDSFGRFRGTRPRPAPSRSSRTDGRHVLPTGISRHTASG